MGEHVADEAAVDAVLLASRSLIAIATQSLGQAAEDTTLAQYRALVVLARGSAADSDLAQALGVAPSTAGRMCDRLVRKGLTRRQRERMDRRAVRVQITPAGRQVIDEATTRRRELIAGVLRALPAGEQLAVARSLRAFAVASGEVPDDMWPAAAGDEKKAGARN